MAKTIHFKKKSGYKKWLAYGHMHKVFKGKKRVTIGGKSHKVQHARS